MLEATAVQAPCFPTGFPRERRFPNSSAVPLRGYDFRRRKAKKAVASNMAGERLEGKTNGYLEWLTPHLNGYK
jgi:hypothetical protein